MEVEGSMGDIALHENAERDEVAEAADHDGESEQAPEALVPNGLAGRKH